MRASKGAAATKAGLLLRDVAFQAGAEQQRSAGAACCMRSSCGDLQPNGQYKNGGRHVSGANSTTHFRGQGVELRGSCH